MEHRHFDARHGKTRPCESAGGEFRNGASAAGKAAGGRPSPGGRLAEYSALEYILLGDLRDLLEERADRYTRSWLIAILDALLDTLPRELAIKEADGYLNEVLAEYPSWYRQVDDLQNEERLLVLSLQSLRDRLDTAQPYELDAARVKRALQNWMKRLVAHHRHETRLLQTAMNLEVGTGD